MTFSSNAHGSSPLSRGIRACRWRCVSCAGIIPALAGNTRPIDRSTNPASDHPRSRGEYVFVVFLYSPNTGSSPLSRGIPGLRFPCARASRIIPALAGNTGLRSPVPRSPRDHPRSRGEYSWTPKNFRSSRGSSPLSRGIRGGTHRPPDHGRIIPALAGNTRRAASASRGRTDHPRSRGEYGRHGCPRLAPEGSSPLSRGIREAARSCTPSPGIIPALAGNTQRQLTPRRAARDHPRSRGEYIRSPGQTRPHLGSSPLSRGIQLNRVPMAQWRRIIPALAGNTGLWVDANKEHRDHPRSRGEYLLGWCQSRDLLGSSPLSRGILCITKMHTAPIRIIPALAGNTSPRNE